MWISNHPPINGLMNYLTYYMEYYFARKNNALCDTIYYARISERKIIILKEYKTR